MDAGRALGSPPPRPGRDAGRRLGLHVSSAESRAAGVWVSVCVEFGRGRCDRPEMKTICPCTFSTLAGCEWRWFACGTVWPPRAISDASERTAVTAAAASRSSGLAAAMLLRRRAAVPCLFVRPLVANAATTCPHEIKSRHGRQAAGRLLSSPATTLRAAQTAAARPQTFASLPAPFREHARPQSLRPKRSIVLLGSFRQPFFVVPPSLAGKRFVHLTRPT